MKETEVNNKFEGEEVGQVKMTKVEKFFEKQKAKYNAHVDMIEKSLGNQVNQFIGSHNAKMDNFIKSANEAIAKSDAKFSGMYNMMIKKFLGDLEQRIYMNELSSNTQLAYFIDKLHQLELKSGETTLDLAAYTEEAKAAFTDKMKTVHQENVEAEEIKNATKVSGQAVENDVPAEAPAVDLSPAEGTQPQEGSASN